MISTDKIAKKIKEYQTFVLKAIFSEYEQKGYIGEMKKIVQKMKDTIQAVLKGGEKNSKRVHI